jgi:hypothetical protein
MSSEKQTIVQLFKENEKLFSDPYDPDRLERKILQRIDNYEEDMDLYDFDILVDDFEQLSREDLSDSEKEIVRDLAKKVDTYLNNRI